MVVMPKGRRKKEKKRQNEEDKEVNRGKEKKKTKKVEIWVCYKQTLGHIGKTSIGTLSQRQIAKG